jgi:PAS domain S-box-containing protein
MATCAFFSRCRRLDEDFFMKENSDEHGEAGRQETALTNLPLLLDALPAAIYSTDAEGHVLFYNHAAAELWGREPVIGKELWCGSYKIFRPDGSDMPLEECPMAVTLKEGRAVHGEEIIVERPDGTRKNILPHPQPLRDHSGKIVGAVNMLIDITERKGAEAELKLAHDAAQKANRDKDDFLAALSHELRTPLSPVLLLASDAANNRDLPPRVRTDFDTICKNIELEARLIDDLLDLSRLTLGKLTVDMKLVDAREPLLGALEKIENDISQKRIVLALDLSDEKFFVKGDVVRLQQVFWNILKNAVKFTPVNGNITVTSRADAGKDELVIAISDSGMGMSAAESSHVFEAFSQSGQTEPGKQSGGLGLGLAISQKLVDLHSGELHAASEGPDKGSTFTIKLPLAKNTGQSPEKSDNAPSSDQIRKTGLRILVVEDHEPTRTSLTQLLLRRRHKITAVASLGGARAAVKNENFDLLISDIGLPDGTGFDLMRELQHGYGLKGIALTGFGTEEDIDLSRKSGFVTHLTKPVRMESLDEALAAAIKV